MSEPVRESGFLEFKRQFGQKVQSHRRRRQMTQEELAEKIHRSTDTVSNIERGMSSTRIETAFRIAEALDVPVMDLTWNIRIDPELLYFSRSHKWSQKQKYHPRRPNPSLGQAVLT